MDPQKEPSFEQSLAELEEIAAQLEVGNTPLDESLALYEKGVFALKRCHAMLDKAEKRIRALVQDAEGGVALREVEMPQAARGAGAPSSAEGAPEGSGRSPAPEYAGASAKSGPKPEPEARKTKKHGVSWPTVDTPPPPRKNEGAAGESAQRPGNAPGKAGGLLFGGSQ